MAIFDWEWGRNLPLEMGRKSPGLSYIMGGNTGLYKQKDSAYNSTYYLTHNF